MGKSVGGVDFPEAIEGRVSGLFRHLFTTQYEGKKKRHHHNYTETGASLFTTPTTLYTGGIPALRWSGSSNPTPCVRIQQLNS